MVFCLKKVFDLKISDLWDLIDPCILSIEYLRANFQPIDDIKKPAGKYFPAGDLLKAIFPQKTCRMSFIFRSLEVVFFLDLINPCRSLSEKS